MKNDRKTQLQWLALGILFCVPLQSIADDDESPERKVRYRTAISRLFRLQIQNIRQTTAKAATLADIKKILPQAPSSVTVIAPPKRTEKNKNRLLQMVYIRNDKYIIKSPKPEEKDKTIFVVYRRVMRGPKDLEKPYREFKDREWLFIEFIAKDKLPSRYTRLDREGKPIPKEKENPGDKPNAAGG